MTGQLPRYSSLFPDPSTEVVDAIPQDWSGERNFINPVFWMLNKVVKKVIMDKANVTIIAPKWPAQVWFQKLKKIAVSTPLTLPNNPRMMLPRADVPEPMKTENGKFRLGKCMEEKSKKLALVKSSDLCFHRKLGTIDLEHI